MNSSTHLRPMSPGEILDMSVILYRQNFHSLILSRFPVALFSLITNTIFVWAINTQHVTFQVFLGQLQFDSRIYLIERYTEPLNQWVVLSIVLFHIAVVYPLTLSAVTKVVSDSLLKISTSTKNAYTFGFKELHKIGLTNIIITLVSMIVYFVPGIILIMAYEALVGLSVGETGTLLSVLTGLALMGILWTRFALIYPVMVNEHKFSFRAIVRSWNLVKGYTTRTFLSIFSLFLVSICLVIFHIIIEIILGRNLIIFSLLVCIVIQGLVLPLVDTARVVVYFELRARKEGLDLVQRTEDLIEPQQKPGNGCEHLNIQKVLKHRRE